MSDDENLAAFDPKAVAREEYDRDLGWAIGGAQHEVEVDAVREETAERLARIYGASSALALWRGVVGGIAKQVERAHEVDVTGQLHIGAVIRTGPNVIVPLERAHRLDWIAHDDLREAKFQEHAVKRARERERNAEIIARYDGHPDDATTIDVAPDLFAEDEENTGS